MGEKFETVTEGMVIKRRLMGWSQTEPACSLDTMATVHLANNVEALTLVMGRVDAALAQLGTDIMNKLEDIRFEVERGT